MVSGSFACITSNETDFDGALAEDDEEDRKGHKFIFCLDGYYIRHCLKETKRRRNWFKWRLKFRYSLSLRTVEVLNTDKESHRHDQGRR